MTKKPHARTQNMELAAMQPHSVCLRSPEVATRLGLSREQVLRLMRGRRLPAFKIGRVWLTRVSDLERFLDLKEKYFL